VHRGLQKNDLGITFGEGAAGIDLKLSTYFSEPPKTNPKLVMHGKSELPAVAFNNFSHISIIRRNKYITI